MRLLRSEFLRARSRRLVWMVIVGGLVAIVVGLGIAAVYSSPASASEIATAQAQADKNIERCVQGRFIPEGQVPAGYSSLEEYCRDTVHPYLSDAGVWLHDLPQILLGISMFVILLGAWLGASLAGADWTNNTMTTLLTWEPRRIRVLLTRAFVVLVVVGLVTLFLQAAFVAVFDLVANVRGNTVFSPSNLWADVAATAGRVSAVGVAIGLVAFAVAMLGRSTVASLGALFGYLVLFEGVIAGFRPSTQSYLLVRAVSVIASQTPIVDYARGTMSIGSSITQSDPAILLDVQGALAVVAVYVVGLLAIALVVFRRRDVS